VSALEYPPFINGSMWKAYMMDMNMEIENENGQNVQKNAARTLSRIIKIKGS
jgi:hypothetical protein